MKEGLGMSTILDVWDNFKAKYITRSEKEVKEEVPNISDVTDVQNSFFANEKNRVFEPDLINGKKLDMLLMRKIALTAPFFMKGINKKYMDVFRAWFKLEKYETYKEPPKVEKDIIRDFEKRTDIKKKFKIAAACSAIYGNGLILKTYINDQDKKVPDTKLPVKEGAEPWQLYLLNPECVKEIIPIKGEAGKFIFHYVNSKTSENKFIHSSRIIHIKEDELPFSNFGISKIVILRHILNARVKIDIASGNILSWFSHGITEWRKIEGELSPNKRDEMLKTMSNHPDYYATDGKYELKIHNPESIDPTPFYTWIKESIAAVLVMPVPMLVGVQVGKVTGAETQFSDYYRDVKDIQDIVYSPLIEDLYSELLESYGRQFNYNVVWNEIYVNEQAEAELDAKRAGVVFTLKNANVIDTKEAREKMNRGAVKLDLEKKIKELSNPQNSLPFNKAPNNTGQVEKPEKEKAIANFIKKKYSKD